MYLVPLLKLLHVASALWFIAGLVARDFTRMRAFKTLNIVILRTLMELASFFDRKMVQPGSVLVLLLGLILARLQHWPILGDFHRGNSNWVFVSLILYLSVAALIPFFLRRGKKFRAIMEDAIAQEEITPELRNAFHNRAITIAHIYEYVVVAVVFALMILKPF
jgi:uncharacterized membrane protein